MECALDYLLGSVVDRAVDPYKKMAFGRALHRALSRNVALDLFTENRFISTKPEI